MIDEAKRWKEILERTVTINSATTPTITMKLEQLLEWLWTEYGFCKSAAQVILVSQWQRGHDHRDQERKQYAKNHYCGGNCESCSEYSCNVCSECPEIERCGGYKAICEMHPNDVCIYAEKLAAWICDLKKKGADHD